MLNIAFTAALKAKGLKLDDTALDIEVQHDLGLKAVQSLTLEPIENLNAAAINQVVPGGEASHPSVNIVDTSASKPVWRVKTTAHLPS